MCLSNIYKIEDNNKELVFKNAANIKIEDNQITVLDIMGRESIIKGSVKSIDLMENEIILNNTK